MFSIYVSNANWTECFLDSESSLKDEETPGIVKTPVGKSKMNFAFLSCFVQTLKTSINYVPHV